MTKSVPSEIVSNDSPMGQDRLKEVLQNWHKQYDPEKGVAPTEARPIKSTSARWKSA